MTFSSASDIQKDIVTEGNSLLTIKESEIRRMTRLSNQHGAINLSQGFPNSGPPSMAKRYAIAAILGGNAERMNEIMHNDDFLNFMSKYDTEYTDVFNQYCPPFGLECLRRELAMFYINMYLDKEILLNQSKLLDTLSNNITICLGSTEATASAFRSILSPGDKCLIFEPFHELYPNQLAVFYAEPLFTSLKLKYEKWEIDWDDFETKISTVKAMILNTPHNPTGKRFTCEEIERILTLCIKYNIYIITDEIYEFIIYEEVDEYFNYSNDLVYSDPHVDESLVDFTYNTLEFHKFLHWYITEKNPLLTNSKNVNLFKYLYTNNTFSHYLLNHLIMINSMSKTNSMTGWRVGWTITPTCLTGKIRAIHDQIVLQAPTPFQMGLYKFIERVNIAYDYYNSNNCLKRKIIDSNESKLLHKIAPILYFLCDLPYVYYLKKNVIVDRLRKLKFKIASPESAYYIFTDYSNVPILKDIKNSWMAAEYLVTVVGVGVVYGNNFYSVSDDEYVPYLRFCFCRSVGEIEQAMDRLEEKLKD